MEDRIFIPKKIKVGFNKREDTYSKKLAYVTYYDEKNKLRKELSWEGWRDKKISPEEFDNEPMSGFVLNRKVGGVGYSSWNPRQTYVRVFDPRGFELEITIPNLLWILENSNSIKGKGLEGEFLYGWSGKELVLVPTSTPDYKKIKDFTDGLYNYKVTKKDLVEGATYKFSKGEDFVYLGHHNVYGQYDADLGLNKGKHHWFCDLETMEKNDFNKNSYKNKLRTTFFCFNFYKGIPKIVQCLNKESHPNYANAMDYMEKDVRYKPLNFNDFKKIPLTSSEVRDLLKKNQHSVEVLCVNNIIRYISSYSSWDGNNTRVHMSGHGYMEMQEFVNKFKPVRLEKIKKNKQEEVSNASSQE